MITPLDFETCQSRLGTDWKDHFQWCLRCQKATALNVYSYSIGFNLYFWKSCFVTLMSDRYYLFEFRLYLSYFHKNDYGYYDWWRNAGAENPNLHFLVQLYIFHPFYEILGLPWNHFRHFQCWSSYSQTNFTFEGLTTYSYLLIIY